MWKEVDGYSGQYVISDSGILMSLIPHHGSECREIKPTLDRRGYPRVCIGNRPNRKAYRIHRLVACAFIPNPENKKTVNHINGIKTDNRVENLEWATYSENIIHAFKYLGKKMPENRGVPKSGKDHFRSKRVIQIDKKTNEVLNTFESGNIAYLATGIWQANISRCATGGVKTAGGYKWKHA
jgi:hypothetical protein